MTKDLALCIKGSLDLVKADDYVNTVPFIEKIAETLESILENSKL
jgi:hypothetical protein